MTIITQGTASANMPETINLPEEAGRLSPAETNRIPRARKGLGLVCEKTSQAMAQDPARLTVNGVTAEELRAAGAAAEDIDQVIVDLEVLLLRIKQGNLLLDAIAHEKLRRVLAHVRSQSKFDPRLPDAVPALIDYFSNTKSDPDTGSTPA